MLERLLDTKAAAEFLGLSQQTLKTARLRGNGPPYCKLSPSVVRYRKEDLDAWVAARVVTNTAQENAQTRQPLATASK